MPLVGTGEYELLVYGIVPAPAPPAAWLVASALLALAAFRRNGRR